MAVFVRTKADQHDLLTFPTEIYNDRLMAARTRRYADISSIGVEHELPRSYTTIEECKALAKAAFGGARIIRTTRLTGTIALDAVTKLASGEGVFSLGEDVAIIDAEADEVFATAGDLAADQDLMEVPPPELLQEPAKGDAREPKRPKPRASKRQSMKFARPANLKEMK